MRYAVYKQLNDLSTSIIEAIDYIKQNLNAINLLEDCVVAVLTIKDVFGKNDIEMEETDDFLKVVERIVDCFEKNEEYTGHINELLDLAKKINLYCKNEIKYKFKILFIAELGSKWDSMDSVYWAYKNRDDCEVEVVISPIFRAVKYPNGEIKSDIIYNDYLTSMGIKHTPFAEYDIKKDLPDITFTSQPYESVAPEQFWAENIAPYTHLVYLPYYTSAGIYNNENTQCQMPIHQLAWKVVCQSEKAKEAYSQYCSTKGANMIACGLPKWDWVINMNSRDIQLPKTWEKLKGKRVMLYCTHYASMNTFDKTAKAYVDFLKKFGKDSGIIFRLHPMAATIIKLYFPQYLGIWNDFIDVIDKSENAVIDRFESYDYAFKFSDFLCTNPSSIIYQYYLTNKPIIIRYPVKEDGVRFIQNQDIGEIANDENLYCLIQNMFDGNSKTKFLKDEMINLDGKIGERLANQLLQELKNEI